MARRNHYSSVDIETGNSFPFDALHALCADCRLSLKAPASYQEVDAYSETSALLSITDEGVHDNAVFAARRYAICKSFSKYIPTDMDLRPLEARTIQKWTDCERSCLMTDDRLYDDYPIVSGFMERVLTRAQSICAYVLKDDPYTPGLLSRWARFGPGATIGNTRQYSDIASKHRRFPYSVTERCIDVGAYYVSTDMRWMSCLATCDPTLFLEGSMDGELVDLAKPFFMKVSGNRVVLVPKNRKILRPIAVEPTINQYVQLGVDGYIRRRLRRLGIDLNDQTLNQRLACLGSLNGSFDTLDLESASDTISISAVRILFPSVWVKFLCDIRSPSGMLDTKEHVYAKLSSMGNGSTFVVESLIFASLARAVMYEMGCVNQPWHVYGDDIVVPSSCSLAIKHVLEYMGFIVNNEKSLCGNIPVRESCGTDWYRGNDIRPPFVKAAPSTLPELFHTYNQWYLWYAKWGPKADFASTHLGTYLRKFVPRGFRYIEGPVWDNTRTHLFTQRPSRTHMILKEVPRLRPQPDFHFGRLANRLKPRKLQPWDLDISDPNDPYDIPYKTDIMTDVVRRYDVEECSVNEY